MNRFAHNRTVLDCCWHNLLSTHLNLNFSDVPVPSESSASHCSTANRAKILKRPTPTPKVLPAKTNRVGRLDLNHAVLLCRTNNPDGYGAGCVGGCYDLVVSVIGTLTVCGLHGCSCFQMLQYQHVQQKHQRLAVL